eukprot:Hpha_TRINITY_DN24796_c0_g1::TRINITY_DN24796_c0_g1_i1::g.110229::m.110229
MFLKVIGPSSLFAKVKKTNVPWSVDAMRPFLGPGQEASLRRLLAIDDAPGVLRLWVVGGDGKKQREIGPKDTPKSLSLRMQAVVWVELDNSAPPPPPKPDPPVP